MIQLAESEGVAHIVLGKDRDVVRKTKERKGKKEGKESKRMVSSGWAPEVLNRWASASG